MKYIYTFFSMLIILTVLSLSTNIFSGNANMAFYVIPPNYATTGGTASFLGPLSNAQRTYQFLIHDTLINDMEGKELSAISVRLLPSATSNWPPAMVTYANYDIYLSESVAPQDRSLTFANNVVGVQKLVRSGTLTIDTNSYTSGSNPNAFGPEITFDTTYLYTGGHLLIEIRHSVSNGTSVSNDALGTSTAGYGTLFSACWQSSYTATTGLQGNFVIVRVTGNDPVIVKNETEIVQDFTLSQNYPNPFNPTTNINITMQKQGMASVIIYDAAGKEVKKLLNNAALNSGSHKYAIDASELTSGVYFYSLFVNGEKIDTKKMLLMK